MDTLIVSPLAKMEDFKIDKSDDIIIVDPRFDKITRSYTDFHLIILDFRELNPSNFFKLYKTEIKEALLYGSVLIILISNGFFKDDIIFKIEFDYDLYLNLKYKVKKNIEHTTKCPQNIRNYLSRVNQITGIIGNKQTYQNEKTDGLLYCEHQKPFQNLETKHGNEPFCRTERARELVACRVFPASTKGQIFLLPSLDDKIKNQYQLLYEIGKDALKNDGHTNYIEPEWVKNDFYILDEKELLDKKDEYEQELSKTNSILSEYNKLKSTLYIKNDDLIDPIIDVFHKLGCKTDRIEKYEEDFWILDEKGDKAIICEVKSNDKSIGRKHINNLDNHREMNKLPLTFPALLIANTYCKANNQTEKDIEISPDLRQLASNNNLLILRTLDLLNLLTLINKPNSDINLFEILTNNNGWLKATQTEYQILHE